MDIYTSYSIKIKHYNHIFKETVARYRDAVNFFMWSSEKIFLISPEKLR